MVLNSETLIIALSLSPPVHILLAVKYINNSEIVSVMSVCLYANCRTLVLCMEEVFSWNFVIKYKFV